MIFNRDFDVGPNDLGSGNDVKLLVTVPRPGELVYNVHRILIFYISDRSVNSDPV